MPTTKETMMTNTKSANPTIKDEPHKISDCKGNEFVVFDALGCRVTINGPDAEGLAKDFIRAYNARYDMPW